MKLKSLVSMVVAFIFVLSLITGCGNSSGNGNKDETTVKATESSAVTQQTSESAKLADSIRVMTIYEAEAGGNHATEAGYIFDYFDKFTKDTGIKVVNEKVPWDQIPTNLVVQSQAGNPVDFSQIASQDIPAYTNAGLLEPLDDYFAKDIPQDIQADIMPFEKALVTSPFDGKRYAFLQGVHTRVLFYNKELVKGEPPKNWAELIEQGKAITDEKKGIWGFIFWGDSNPYSSSVSLWPHIWSAGGEVGDGKTDKATFNSPQVAEAIKFMSDTVNVNKITPKICFTAPESEIHEVFKAGKAAFYVTGGYMYPAFKETEFAKNGNLGIAPIPGKNGQAPGCTNGWAWAIPAKAKNKAEAWILLSRWVTTKDRGVEFALASGAFPFKTSESSDPRITKDPGMKAISEVMGMPNGTRPYPPMVHFQEAMAALNEVFVKAGLEPKTDIAAELDKAAAAFNAKYAK